MLIRPELIDRLAETLEGIPVTLSSDSGPGARREASVLVYHSGKSGSVAGAPSGPTAGESPLLEVNLVETDASCSVLVNSALGMVEMHDVDEIRLLETTEEAAFYSHTATGKCSMLTISSRGVLQVYMNVEESLAEMDLPEIADDDLRAAVAMKIFSENSEVFRNTAEQV